MKKHIKNIFQSFFFSAITAMICLMLIEVISSAVGHCLSPMTPEFRSYFPSESVALEVDILLYGLFGIAFSGMSRIYENDRIGFVLQNIIYCVGTAIIWVPVVTFIWQLWKYPQALICTVIGFIVTYVIMTIVAYNTTRKEIVEVNALLASDISS